MEPFSTPEITSIPHRQQRFCLRRVETSPFHSLAPGASLRSIGRLVYSLLLLTLLAAAWPRQAIAQDIAPLAGETVVINANDAGTGSLRQAIADTSAGGTIIFDSSLSGATIRLATELTLAKNVTIDGSALATQVTISGDTNNDSTGDVRLFTVNSGVTATFKNLTFTKGNALSYGCLLYTSDAADE